MADQPKKKPSPPVSPICEGEVKPHTKKVPLEPECFGCKNGKSSQKHHMYEGGCLSAENIEKMFEK